MKGQPIPEGSRTGADKGASWVLYILKCNDGSYYTGITNDLERRFAQHRLGRASRYTRSRRPLRIVYWESCTNRSHASRRESAIKALSHREKQEKVRQGKINL